MGPIERLTSSTQETRYYYSYPDSAAWFVPRLSVSFVSGQTTSGVRVVRTELEDTTTHFFSYSTPLWIDSSSSSKPALFVGQDGLVAGGVRHPSSLFSIVFSSGGLGNPFPHNVSLRSSHELVNSVRRWGMIGFQRDVRDSSLTIYRDYEQRTTNVDYFWLQLKEDGWRTEKIGELNQVGFYAYGRSTLAASYDPNLDEQVWFSSFLSSGVSSYPASFLRFRNVSTGNVRESSSDDYVLPYGEIIPVDSHHIYNLDRSRQVRRYGPTTRWNSDGTTDPVFSPGFSSRFDTVSVQRLYGDRFLAICLDSSARQIDLIVRRLDGELRASRTIALEAENAELPFVMQDPRDSVLILIRNYGEGPAVSLYGPDLQPVSLHKGPILERIPVSDQRAPARDIVGALMGDTLYVAWTDDRTGEPQAYLNAWQMPLDRTWDRRRTSEEWREWEPAPDTSLNGPVIENLTPQQRLERYGFAIFAVTPNPAWRGASVVIGSDVRRGIRLDQYDALGRRIGSALLDVLPGIHEYPLPEVYSAGGLFFVQLSASGHQEATSHFVYPE